MEKKRVYQVAKDFHISSEALVSMLRNLGFEIKSHMSVVDESMFNKVKKQFEKQHDEALKSLQKKEKISEAIDHKESPPPAKEKPKEKKPKEKKPKKAPKKAKPTEETKETKPGKQKKGTPQKETKEETPSRSKKRRERDKERKSRNKQRKQRQKEHAADVQKTFKKTMATLSTESGAKSRKSRARNAQESDTAVEEKPTVKVSEYITVSELAKQMGVSVSTIIAKCMDMGMMVSINQRLDMDSIELLTDEFGYEVEQLGVYAEDVLSAHDQDLIDEKNLKPRPPVVTVMGHVDHGKTSLLDKIRKSDVVSGESGGITQHIGAYSVKLPHGERITFIDTPGHEAFTAMRARGAKVTDIVILVVAADDSVMPQTIEAIDHAKAAEVPIVIAINKVDLPNADPEKIRTDLSRHNVLVEDWGGDFQCQEISAKKNQNIDKLLEKVLLEAEMLELKSYPNKVASGVIIDSKLDKGRGPVATVLIESGTLHVGDSFITGMETGKVRAMINEHGVNVNEVGPAEPVLIFGISGVPRAGDTFYVIEEESEARDIAHQRRQMKREQDFRRIKRVTLDDIYDRIKEGSMKELNLIIKADVDGSMEALSDTLSRITHEEVRVNVIHQAVGAVNENDVLLAAASGAIIIGFHVRPSPAARAVAEREKVEIKLYDVIYEAIEDVEKALKGMLAPRITDRVLGMAEVRDTFKVPKAGIVAGCYVTDGLLRRNAEVHLIRDNIEIYSSKISSLKRFKEDVTEVKEGYECGVSIDGYNDIKVGDMLEVIEHVEEPQV